MGTRTSDDAYLYKPVDGEGASGDPTDSWSDEMNTNIDRLGRMTNQIKALSPNGLELDGLAIELYVVTTNQVSSTAKWTLGGSERCDFDSLNEAATTGRSGHYQHYIDISAAGLDQDDVGLPLAGGCGLGNNNGMALLGIWEEVDSTWVMVASGWVYVYVTGGGPV